MVFVMHNATGILFMHQWIIDKIRRLISVNALTDFHELFQQWMKQ